MPQFDTETADDHFGDVAFHTGLPGAIRTLDNEELRVLLVALLQEWRCRTAAVPE